MAASKPNFRVRAKLAARAAGTILGLSRRGFFIPFRHAAAVPAPPPVYAELEAVFGDAAGVFAEVLEAIAAGGETLVAACTGPLAGHWNGGYFGPLDTAAAFTLVRRAGSARIVEVGSGSSTHVLRAAAPEADIRCIDPMPRRDISALGVRYERSVLTEAHVGLFRDLAPGDVAFFDSSHVLFEGTDVDIIQNRILPTIPRGVLVHVHDIFLPDPYPVDWAHRAYTEQLGLGGWLCGGAFRPVFASRYVATRMRDRASAALAALPPHGAPGGGSLWLERV